MANFGTVGVDWQQRVNWDRLRKYRLERARERMKAHNLGALLLMYDENVRYVTSTLTPGWNRLKPGLRYALLCGDGPPVLFEQGDIGFQIQRHAPWIPKENIRYSYAWIKGAAGPASRQQVKKFTDAIVKEMNRYQVADKPLGVDFIDINMINQFRDSKLTWADGMTAMMEARAIKNEDEQECLRIVGAIGDAAHWETMRFLKPGLTENQVTAHIMEFLYNIPGMEDVEDVIVSSGPNTWPNWRNFSDRIIKPGETVLADLVPGPSPRDPARHGLRARDPARQEVRVRREDRGDADRAPRSHRDHLQLPGRRNHRRNVGPQGGIGGGCASRKPGRYRRGR